MPNINVRALHEHEYPLLPTLLPGISPQHPGFRPENCRAAVVNGQIVAMTMIERRTLRYGGAELRAGILSGFHMGGGYKRLHMDFVAALMRDALARLAEQGAHLALIHDSPDGSGPDFGFFPVWPVTTFACAARDAADLDPPDTLSLRAARPHDVPQLHTLHERHFGAHVTLTRTPQLWLWRIVTGMPPALVVACEHTPTLYGYIAGADLLSSEVEVVADTPESARTLLSYVGYNAVNAGIHELRWIIAPDSVLLAFARDLLDVTLTAHYPRRGGWLARLIDTRGLVDALLPEIDAHLQHSGSTAPAGINAHADRIRIHTSAPVDLTHSDFLQLLFGALTPAALGIKAQLAPPQVAQLGVMFPPRVAGIAVWDW